MGEPKTAKTKASVKQFLDGIEDDQRRADSVRLAKLLEELTGEKPAMWGPSIVGFGSYHYRYASGREGDWPLTGFSPRKQALTLYVMSGFEGEADLLEQLGKFKTGKACLYAKRLDDLHLPTLKKLVRKSVAHMRKRGG